MTESRALVSWLVLHKTVVKREVGHVNIGRASYKGTIQTCSLV